MTEASGTQLILALVIGISALIFMILKTKIHTFLALIISAVMIGLIAGMVPTAVTAAVQAGFGGTLGGIGIIIGFGVMMGTIFEASGAAERMARTFLKLFGKGREEAALAVTGFFVSIPVFCDSAFVILSSLAKSLSRKTKKSIFTLAGALSLGLLATHIMVPPTPGPLGVAGIFGVDVGQMIIFGFIVAIPMMIASIFYFKWLGTKLYQIPSEDGETWIRGPYQPPVYDLSADDSDKHLPSAFLSFLPLLLPVFLILTNTILNMQGLNQGIFLVFIFLGTPVIAVGIGLLLCIYVLAFKSERKVVMENMEKGIRASGIILLVTGGGGALGAVLTQSGVGAFIAHGIAGTPIPIIFLPFVVSTLIRFVQGSGTVAMITSASITAPIVLAAGGNMLMGALAAACGAIFFSHFNDSYFWVVNRLCGVTDAKEQIRMSSISSTVAWGAGLVTIIILNIIIG
ncbi:MAG: GntP family permease [Spirochaetes bacterium]|nr:GntP family permease [Spirochaetota bacterium]